MVSFGLVWIVNLLETIFSKGVEISTGRDRPGLIIIFIVIFQVIG